MFISHHLRIIQINRKVSELTTIIYQLSTRFLNNIMREVLNGVEKYL